MKYTLSAIALWLFLPPLVCLSQDRSESLVSDKVLNFPAGLFSRIKGKAADLDKQLTSQTDKYVARMARREEKLRNKLYKIDSAAARGLFANSAQQYSSLAQKLKTDTGSRMQSIGGEYQPYTDSVKVTLAFLQQVPSAGSLSPKMQAELQSSVSQLQALQAKMQDADQIKAYMQQRKQQIGDYITRHAGIAGALGNQYQGMNQDLFYYSSQVRAYKEMLNSPDQLEQKALSLLNRLPAFQNFMTQNSQLAGLLNLPSGYGTPQGLMGLQTRDQVGSLIQGQIASGGPEGAAALQSNLQSAESQLDVYKDKLTQLGKGSGDIDMPDFKPNDQKTKTFWKRLEYGANFQTTRNNYYFPTVTDLGGSVGYKLSNTSTIGIGASYKIGWGNGIQHIALSSNGIGVRSFIDLKIKGSLSATGGLEYNYTTPINAAQQLRHWDEWTKSGLIGISKTVSLKSRVFKKTRLQLLWDFLSYQQTPRTQAFLFRLGYDF